MSDNHQANNSFASWVRNTVLPFARTHWVWLLIMGALSLFHLHWIILDTSPPLWDIAGHSYRSAAYADLLAHHKVRTILNFDTIYPPLQYLVTAPLYWVFGWHAIIPQLSMLFWLWVYGIALYAIGLKLFKQQVFAALPVLLSAAMPLLVHMSRVYFLDFPVTAAVTAFVALLLYSDGLRKRRMVILAAVAGAAVILIKWVGVLFLLAPLGYALWSWLLRREKLAAGKRSTDQRATLRTIGWGLLTGAALLAPWYLINAQTVFDSFSSTRNNLFSVPYEDLFSFNNAAYYIERTLMSTGWHIGLLLLLGCIYLIWRRFEHRWLLFLWITVPYLIMTFLLHSKESRYILPIYPAIALIASATIYLFKEKWKMIGIALFAAVALFIQLEMASAPVLVPTPLESAAVKSNDYLYRTIRPGNPRYGFQYPTQYHGIVSHLSSDILDALETAPLNSNDNTLKIAVVPNTIFLTAQQIQFYSVLSGLDRISNDWSVDYTLSTLIRDAEDWEAKLSEADFIITKTGGQGPDVWGPLLPEIAEVEERTLKGKTESVFSNYELLQEYQLDAPNDIPQQVRLYRKRTEAIALSHVH